MVDMLAVSLDDREPRRRSWIPLTCHWQHLRRRLVTTYSTRSFPLVPLRRHLDAAGPPRRYPVAYWIAFRGGRYKSMLLFLLLLPFFVSFVIRTQSWKFILADNGMVPSDR